MGKTYIEQTSVDRRNQLIKYANDMLGDDRFVRKFKSLVIGSDNGHVYSVKQSLINTWLHKLGDRATTADVTFIHKLIAAAIRSDPFGFDDVGIKFNTVGEVPSINTVYQAGRGDSRSTQEKLADEDYVDGLGNRPKAAQEAYEDLVKTGFGVVEMDFESVENRILATLNSKADVIKQLELVKGTTMTDKLVTKKFIGSRDASTLSDEEIFQLIKRKEERSDELRAIRSKPKKLLAILNEIDDEITELVKYVDERKDKNDG